MKDIVINLCATCIFVAGLQLIWATGCAPEYKRLQRKFLRVIVNFRTISRLLFIQGIVDA